MPRPRQDVRQEWELRFTPANQDEWISETLMDEFVSRLADVDARILVFEEGGPEIISPKTQKPVKRHYHGHLTTNASHSHIYGCLKILTGGKGQEFYTCVPAHEHTKGYISKCRFIRIQKNYSDEEVESIYEQSAQYRRAKETARKRKQRVANKSLTEIVEQVRNDPAYLIDRSYTNAFRHIAAEYDKEGKSLPSRSVVEAAIVNLLGGEHREQYYLSNFKYNYRL